MVDNSSEGGRWIVTKSGLGFKGCRTRSGLQGSGRSPIKPICAGVKLDAPAVSDSSNFRLLARAVNSSSNRAISARVPIVFFRRLDSDICFRWTKMWVVRPRYGGCVLSFGIFGVSRGLLIIITTAQTLIFQVLELGPDLHANWLGPAQDPPNRVSV